MGPSPRAGGGRHPSAVLDGRGRPRFADPHRFRERVRGDLRGRGPPKATTCSNCADGRVFERFSRSLSVGDRPVGRVWSFRDITPQRRAEEQLRAESERFRTTLASIGDAVVSTDAEGRITFLNRVAER